MEATDRDRERVGPGPTIELANRTEYALTAAIQTGSPARGLALARRLHANKVARGEGLSSKGRLEEKEHVGR